MLLDLIILITLGEEYKPYEIKVVAIYGTPKTSN
jgi:hypothetical protein